MNHSHQGQQMQRQDIPQHAPPFGMLNQKFKDMEPPETYQKKSELMGNSNG
jgi:hypothetical protein